MAALEAVRASWPKKDHKAAHAIPSHNKPKPPRSRSLVKGQPATSAEQEIAEFEKLAEEAVEAMGTTRCEPMR